MGQGLTAEQASEYENSYLIYAKKIKPVGDHNDAILELIMCWDLEKLEIGMIRFLGMWKSESGRIYLGKVEADDLVMDNETKEIIVDEYGEPRHELWKCASTSENFLDAITAAACHMARCMENIEISEDQLLKRRIADKCAEAAGGKLQYKDFYYMLLGCEE